jgi:hypothetical protein
MVSALARRLALSLVAGGVTIGPVVVALFDGSVEAWLQVLVRRV